MYGRKILNWIRIIKAFWFTSIRNFLCCLLYGIKPTKIWKYISIRLLLISYTGCNACIITVYHIELPNNDDDEKAIDISIQGYS